MKSVATTSSSSASPTIQLARRGGWCAAPVEDPQQVQERHQQEAVGRPVVDVADEGPERRLVDDLRHRAVGPLGRGLVGHEQQRPGHREQQEEHHRDAAEAEGAREAQRLGRHGPRVEVEEQHREPRGLALRRGERRSSLSSDPPRPYPSLPRPQRTSSRVQRGRAFYRSSGARHHGSMGARSPATASLPFRVSRIARSSDGVVAVPWAVPRVRRRRPGAFAGTHGPFGYPQPMIGGNR